MRVAEFTRAFLNSLIKVENTIAWSYSCFRKERKLFLFSVQKYRPFKQNHQKILKHLFFELLPHNFLNYLEKI